MNQLYWVVEQAVWRLVLFPTMCIMLAVVALISPNLAADMLQYVIGGLSKFADNILFMEAELEEDDDNIS